MGVINSNKDWLHNVNEWMEKLNPDVRLLNEGLNDRDMTGWINIGVIKNGSNIGTGGDAYLMVDPNYPQTDDFGTYRYRATAYNTKPDGTGYEIEVPTYQKQYLQIYDQYRDTYYGEAFLGKKKTAEQEQKHQMFLRQLEMSGDKVVLKHDSSYKITDGVVKKGQPNTYSNNSDIGIYFWGSKEPGNDQSNGSQYTYYCLVNANQVYDFENDMERYGTLVKAFKHYPFVAQYWKGGPAIVVNSLKPLPITYIKDNQTGKMYNGNWQKIN